MTKKRSINSSADARLAREIEDLLAIDPSPEFLARLRTRLAEEPTLLDARAMGPHKRWWHFQLPVRMGIAIAAMVAAALVLVVLRSPLRETTHKVVAVEVPAETEAVTVPALAPPPSPVKHAVLKPAEPIVTGFFPLMENPPPFERGLLVRIIVPASTMRTVGLPVGDDHLSDPVQADLLVGQDDLARAIRFVSYRKSRDEGEQP